jgi:hypothetical protein
MYPACSHSSSQDLDDLGPDSGCVGVSERQCCTRLDLTLDTSLQRHWQRMDFARLEQRSRLDPPCPLLPDVICKLRAERPAPVLVVPVWPSQTWWTSLPAVSCRSAAAKSRLCTKGSWNPSSTRASVYERTFVVLAANNDASCAR